MSLRSGLRRSLLTVAIMALVLVSAACGGSSDSTSNKVDGTNVILFIGDGMQLQHEVAASRYLHGTDNGLSFHSFPYQTAVATWDVDTYNRYAWNLGNPAYSAGNFLPMLGYDPSLGGAERSPINTTGSDDYFLGKLAGYGVGAHPATDSASAATAMSTGFKTDSGNMAWLPGDPVDGALTTIAETLRDGYSFRIGVASTVPFTHATPGAFVAHSVSRNNYTQMADEIINTVRPDVVIGGGHPNFVDYDPMAPAPHYDYIAEAEYNTLKTDAEYVFVERANGQNASTALMNAAADAVDDDKKLFGLFGGTGSNFEPPVPANAPGSPAVNRATTENPTSVDMAKAALDVLSADGAGLFLMLEQGDIDWANHANNFNWLIGTMWDLDEAVRAIEQYVDSGTTPLDWSNTLLIVTSDHSNSYMRLNRNKPLGRGQLPTQTGEDYDWSYPNGELTYGSTGHTNELVTLAARGAGSNLFEEYEGRWYPGTRIVDNTHIYEVMMRAVAEVGTLNVILVIGDGMNREHEVAASRYLYGNDNGLAWHSPEYYSTWCATWDVDTYNRYAFQYGVPNYNPDSFIAYVGYDATRGGLAPSPVVTTGDKSYFLTKLGKSSDGKYPATDSASAGTAIATGVKTDAGNIAWLTGDPDGGTIETICEKIRRDKDYAIGVVSTVPMSHATPAAFVSHNKSRNNYGAIAHEIFFDIMPDVVLGGGIPDFLPAGDTYDYITEADYNALKTSAAWQFVGRTAGVNGATALNNAVTASINGNKKLAGIFGGAGSNFEPPIPSNTPGSPAVALATNENPTCADMTMAAINRLKATNKPFFLMVEQGDIDWANHANNYDWLIGTMWDLDEAVKSAVNWVNQAGDGYDWSNTLIIVTSDHGNSYMRLDPSNKLGTGELPARTGADYAWNYPNGEVSYSTTDHTNELVSLYAIGDSRVLFEEYEGLWYPGTRIIDNTHIYHVMAKATGIEADSKATQLPNGNWMLSGGLVLALVAFVFLFSKRRED